MFGDAMRLSFALDPVIVGDGMCKAHVVRAEDAIFECATIFLIDIIVYVICTPWTQSIRVRNYCKSRLEVYCSKNPDCNKLLLKFSVLQEAIIVLQFILSLCHTACEYIRCIL
jgi:hypothetical protein